MSPVYIYVLHAPERGIIKIGKAVKPNNRANNICAVAGVGKLSVFYARALESDDLAKRIERQAHKLMRVSLGVGTPDFSSLSDHSRYFAAITEWYEAEPSLAVAVIDRLIDATWHEAIVEGKRLLQGNARPIRASNPKPPPIPSARFKGIWGQTS